MGRTIVREGHPARFFYIVLDGEIEISVVDKAALEAAKEGKKAANVAANGAFDEKKESKVKESDLERAYIRNLGSLHSGDSFGDAGNPVLIKLFEEMVSDLPLSERQELPNFS